MIRRMTTTGVLMSSMVTMITMMRAMVSIFLDEVVMVGDLGVNGVGIYRVDSRVG